MCAWYTCRNAMKPLPLGLLLVPFLLTLTGCKPVSEDSQSGPLLYVTNYRGEAVNVYESKGDNEKRLLAIPASSVGGPGFLCSPDSSHTVIVRGLNGQKLDEWELSDMSTRTVVGQAAECFYACSGYAGFEPIAGRDPRRDPRYDSAPWMARFSRINPLIALGLLGWATTITVWFLGRRCPTKTAPKPNLYR